MPNPSSDTTGKRSGASRSKQEDGPSLQESAHLMDMTNLADESHATCLSQSGTRQFETHQSGTRQLSQHIGLDPVSMGLSPEMEMRDEMNCSADGPGIETESKVDGERQRVGDNEPGEDEQEFRYEKTGTFVQPPSIAEAEEGLSTLKAILKPPWKNGPGYEHHGLDELTYSRLVAMRGFLWKYISSGAQTTRWAAVFLEVARDHERGAYHARQLREWTLAFLAETISHKIYMGPGTSRSLMMKISRKKSISTSNL